MSEQLRGFFNKKKPQHSASNPLLPDEQVLWEGRAKLLTHAAVAMILLLLISVLAILFVAFVFLDENSRRYVISVGLVALFIYSCVIAIIYFFIKKRYILTSERLIIQTIDFKKVTAVNCNFSQILEFSLKNKFGISYIELITPYKDIPTTLYPSKNLQEFYEALSLLWQFGIKPEEKTRLQRLYYPPWKSWISYSVFSGVFCLICFLLMQLPSLFSWNNSWLGIIRPFGFFLILGTAYGRIFASLFLGKEFSFLNTRVNFNHRLVELGILLMFIVPSVILLPIKP